MQAAAARGFNSRAREGRDTARPALAGRLGVSIHAPARGATKSVTTMSLAPLFQFTRPRGARLQRHGRPRGGGHGFNSRAREGRDVLRDRALPCFHPVSIHAPARGATLSSLIFASRVAVFQFTRPRGARLNRRGDVETFFSVSIHAPARGATIAMPHICAIGKVSIHAPARGATTHGFSLLIQNLQFQFTRPRGARRNSDAVLGDVMRVSIHAPARGATSDCPE